MYSLVLMMSMTSAPETPNWWFCHKSYSCSGCNGSAWAVPGYSYACSGCAGNATSYTSCLGYAGNYYVPFGCYGYGIYGGTSYSFPIMADPNPTAGYGYGMPYPASSIPRIETDKDKGKKPEVKPPDTKDKTMIYPVPSNRAQVLVRLPANAKLFANNQVTALDSAERVFTTPALEKGQEYQYEMRIEFARDGKTVTDKQVVKVRAGSLSVVEFGNSTKTIAAASVIKFVAPQGATLYVDNKLLNATEYTTPELVKGAEYAYEVRGELTRDGKSQKESRRVVFKAGEAVMVDFSDLGSVRTAAAR
jgi:uncharacterized protein (TIGR03000 family)